jgi:malate dehydrogenase (oxaloacetate-decarboxylating)
MLATAARAIANLVDVKLPGASLLPQVEDLRNISETVAIAVAKTAVKEDLAGEDFWRNQ